MKIENDVQESYGGEGGSYPAPIPPNKVDAATVVPRPGIRSGEFARLLATDRAIGIRGEIKYMDSYGTDYQTTFCLEHLATGRIIYCNDGNDMKSSWSAQK
jgi:hypothetical protein